MRKTRERLIGLICAVALLGSVSACGGSSADTTTPPTGNTPDPVTPAPGGNDSPPETIQGVTTPSSVSVVTATNAN